MKEFYNDFRLGSNNGSWGVESELAEDLSKGIADNIDRLILKSALGYIFENKSITFLDKRYNYPQQRVTLSIHTEITPYKIQEVVYECNRSERSYDDYIKNFNKWVKAGYLKKIEGDVDYFVEMYGFIIDKR